MVLNEPEFYLVKKQGESKEHRLVIDDIYLETTKAVVIPSIVEAHHSLFKKQDAIFPMRRVRTSEKVIPVDTTSTEFDVFLPGQVPTTSLWSFCHRPRWSETPLRSRCSSSATICPTPTYVRTLSTWNTILTIYVPHT